MSLGNAVAFEVTEEEFHLTPSRKDGVDELTEFDLRVYGCEVIQQACIILKLCAQWTSSVCLRAQAAGRGRHSAGLLAAVLLPDIGEEARRVGASALSNDAKIE